MTHFGVRLIYYLLLLVGHIRTQSFLSLSSYLSRNQIEKNITSQADDEVYDFVVVGAGTGGSVVANRLSENPYWRVLLIEAGSSETLLSQIPLLNLLQPVENDWGYKTQPQEDACLGMKRSQCAWPTGKALGGTSTMAYMVHSRGHRLDYNIWASLGNDGWSYQDVLPYFKKSEKFNIPGLNNSTYHSNVGFVNVEQVPYKSDYAKAFIAAGQRLGYKVVDYNGKGQIGFSYVQVNMHRGRSCSASTAYLKVRRPNLHVMTGAHVTKVIIKNHKAVGVEYLKNSQLSVARASKEVVVCAGTINSAQLLMLSGIGPRFHLEKHGIPVIKDAPVGHNLYEHVGFMGLIFTVNQTRSQEQKQSANQDSRPIPILEFAFSNDNPTTIPGGVEALAFVRSKYATDFRPDIELLFLSGHMQFEDGIYLKRSLGLTDEMYDTVYKPIENKDTWSIWPIAQNPRSVGRVKLRSNNPLDSPVIEANLLQHPDDVDIILEGVKRALEISKTEPFAALGSELLRAEIAECDDSEFGSDDYWRCAIRYLTLVMNHEVGTCKMGSSLDPTAVVDSKLRVYGVDSLRVADASIMPAIPAAHTNAVVYMIGEKAADIIKEAWDTPDK